MRFFPRRFCLIFLILLLCLTVQGASAWVVKNMEITPKSGPLAPGTAVKVEFMVYFDSWIDGETFDSQHTLDMYTELKDPQWAVTLVTNNDPDSPITTALTPKPSMRYRIDGWTLSYDPGQLNLYVTLHGKAPSVAQLQDKTIILVEELDEVADVMSAGKKVVKYQVGVPAPATTAQTPAPVPTTMAATATTPLPTTAPTTSPTVKQTYSPGPAPALIVLSLAGLIAAAGLAGRGKIR